jgi:PleD family two-component response regulator
MNILILDRDRYASQSLVTQLEELGHIVVLESVRKTAIERINAEQFDIIFIDPAPLPSPREITLPLRWEQRADYFYMILMGHDFDDQDVLFSGMNDRIAKNFDPAELLQKVTNAERLVNFMKSLATKNNWPSDNKIFGQRAFHQLMLSALDRAYRYNEQAFLLVIQLKNANAILDKLGEEKGIQVLEELGVYLSKMHRMSDFLGHSDVTDYALLILRPTVNTEPQDAAERFMTALRDFEPSVSLPIKPEFNIELWALPSAELKFKS